MPSPSISDNKCYVTPGARRKFGSKCVDPVSHVFLWFFINIMTILSQYMMITNYSFFNCQELFSSRGHLEGLSNSLDSDECNLPRQKILTRPRFG